MGKKYWEKGWGWGWMRGMGSPRVIPKSPLLLLLPWHSLWWIPLLPTKTLTVSH